jgi:hypothetical protein
MEILILTGTTLFDLAKTGIESFLSHLEKSSKLEFVSLIGYSSQCELLCPFTRDLQVNDDSLFLNLFFGVHSPNLHNLHSTLIDTRQCFSTAGTRPGTRTWKIRETRNLSEITMKSSILRKSHKKNLSPGQLATNNNCVIGTKDKKFILPGLGPEKIRIKE